MGAAIARVQLTDVVDEVDKVFGKLNKVGNNQTLKVTVSFHITTWFGDSFSIKKEPLLGGRSNDKSTSKHAVVYEFSKYSWLGLVDLKAIVKCTVGGTNFAVLIQDCQNCKTRFLVVDNSDSSVSYLSWYYHWKNEDKTKYRINNLIIKIIPNKDNEKDVTIEVSEDCSVEIKIQQCYKDKYRTMHKIPFNDYHVFAFSRESRIDPLSFQDYHGLVILSPSEYEDLINQRSNPHDWLSERLITEKTRAEYVERVNCFLSDIAALDNFPTYRCTGPADSGNCLMSLATLGVSVLQTMKEVTLAEVPEQ